MATAQRLVQSHYSSSSSDEEDEAIGTRDVKKGKILASTFTTYTDQTGNTTRRNHTSFCLLPSLLLQTAVHLLSLSSVTRLSKIQPQDVTF